MSMDPSARFWDKVADRYARRPIADEAAYRTKLEITRGYLRPEMELLEIGCGTGSTALIHAPFVARIRAIDFSANMIGIARRKAQAAGIGNVEFACATVDEVQAPDGSFDAVLALNVLHLLEHRREALAKVHRLLKPGGAFVTSTVCLGDSWLRVIGLLAPIGRLVGLMPAVKILKAEQLVAELGAAGFSIDHRCQPGDGVSQFIVALRD